MEEVLEAVVLGRACRNAAAIKNRQPISRMYVKMGAGDRAELGLEGVGGVIPHIFRVDHFLHVQLVPDDGGAEAVQALGTPT